jgi:outer membrane receptor for Fe3+-dicitrate
MDILNITLKVSEQAFDEINTGQRFTLEHGFSCNKKYLRLFNPGINDVTLIASKTKRTLTKKFKCITVFDENNKRFFEISLQ